MLKDYFAYIVHCIMTLCILWGYSFTQKGPERAREYFEKKKDISLYLYNDINQSYVTGILIEKIIKFVYENTGANKTCCEKTSVSF